MALNKKNRPNPFQYRGDIITSVLLGAGLYMVLYVAGNRIHPMLAIGVGVIPVLLFRLLDRSSHSNKHEECEKLLFQTRYGIDFSALARDLYQVDAPLAEDLKTVLVAGNSDPGNLSDYSILHLWACVRTRISEIEEPDLPI